MLFHHYLRLLSLILYYIPLKIEPALSSAIVVDMEILTDLNTQNAVLLVKVPTSEVCLFICEEIMNAVHTFSHFGYVL